MQTEPTTIDEQFIEYVLGASKHAKLYTHPPSKTSEESMHARTAPSVGRASNWRQSPTY
jgi:hypothetical protein